MVKRNLVPGIFAVAASAFFTQLAIMRITFFVAAVTFGWCIAVFFIRLVAGVAGNLPVFSLKGEIGMAVIESLFIQLDDVGFSPFMIGMALFAFLSDGKNILSMEALFQVQVFFDVLMAIGT